MYITYVLIYILNNESDLERCKGGLLLANGDNYLGCLSHHDKTHLYFTRNKFQQTTVSNLLFNSLVQSLPTTPPVQCLIIVLHKKHTTALVHHRGPYAIRAIQ